MLSRKEIEDFRARHMTAREQLVARVNVCQGAIDAATAMLKTWDENEKKAEEDDAKGEAAMNDTDPTEA